MWSKDSDVSLPSQREALQACSSDWEPDSQSHRVGSPVRQRSPEQDGRRAGSKMRPLLQRLAA